MSFTLTETFEKETCCTCGVTFGVPSDLIKQRRQDHGWFYCPNGHAQHYNGKTEADKLRDELVREKHRAEQLEASRREAWADRDKVQKRLNATKGAVTRIKNRVSHGVCPCCNRTFKQLAAHMKTKHPEYNGVGDEA